MEYQSIIAHVPVISRAYLNFLESHESSTDRIYIVDETITEGIDGIRKDLRRLNPEDVVSLLTPRFQAIIQTLGREGLAHTIDNSDTVIMPDDEVSKHILNLHPVPTEKLKLDPLFLRWHRLNTTVDTDVDSPTVTLDTLPTDVIMKLKNEVQDSNEWWRQVGCVFYKDGKILESTHNCYTPSETTAEIDGDIRSQAYRGTSIEVANTKHAEATAIAKAARSGNVLDGSSCLVSTFPCPVCAKMLVDSGIKEVYFVNGYAVADGLEILRAHDIAVNRIEVELPPPKTIPIPYVESSERS